MQATWSRQNKNNKKDLSLSAANVVYWKLPKRVVWEYRSWEISSPALRKFEEVLGKVGRFYMIVSD